MQMRSRVGVRMRLARWLRLPIRGFIIERAADFQGLPRASAIRERTSPLPGRA